MQIYGGFCFVLLKNFITLPLKTEQCEFITQTNSIIRYDE